MSVNFSDCMSSLENGPEGEPVWTIVQSNDPNRPGNYWALCSENVLGDPSSTCSIENTMFQRDKPNSWLDNVHCKNNLTTNNVPSLKSGCSLPGCGIDYTQPADLSQFSKVRDYKAEDPMLQQSCADGNDSLACSIYYNTQPANSNQFSGTRDYSESYRAPCCRPTQYVNLSSTWGGQKPYSL